MAENVAGMRVEGTMIVGTHAQRGQGRGLRFGVYGVIAAVLVAMLIGGVTLHDRQASHPVAPAIPHATSQQTRFLEDNTTNLPNGVTAETRPVTSEDSISSETVNYYRTIDGTTHYDRLQTGQAATETAPSALSTSQQRFLEVNTVMLAASPTYPYAEDVTPLPGQTR